ncbi:CTP synthase [Nematocida ausubeli]|uniref:CTP synthase n=1 Tax=Nematocida ausubeli (strain ATCC PRA-371 / ERTm2) TaxID=1913371 RepID=A0A086J4X2_NEMA1|nr:CTP synthase [Nematocida ausubeli]KAI5132889.1 CTP synthase [Nematocida ausubeli]KAI5146674.1 CTP synthase [Nematocida ausubeli]KFG27190.1 CTP synthase [Nematocida ausubeli]
MKYILVCGGVISGVGKGVIASSVGRILKEEGEHVTIVKIDPYLNFNAGTLGPRDHGEVFVLDDGTETDLDLGNYERFLGSNLTKFNSITSGRIYSEVIKREREGEYLGKTVQVVPHVTDHIKNSIRNAACLPIENNTTTPTVCVIELGGIVGDIESTTFIEALRQMYVEEGREKFVVIGVDYALEVNGEHKTKPIQGSAKRARELGIPYDVIVCRSETAVAKEALEKISLFTGVEKLVLMPNCNVLSVPELLLKQTGILSYLQKRLNMKPVVSDHMLEKGKYFEKITDEKKHTCKVAIVGKYSNHEDAYLSIKESLKFAGSVDELSADIETTYFDTSFFLKSENLSILKEFDGIVIPGGFGKRGVEQMILVAGYARVNKIPLLGICLGMQVIAIEYARSILNIQNATSEELVAEEEDIHTIIDDRINEFGANQDRTVPHSLIISKHSNHMRIGRHETETIAGSRMAAFYGNSNGSIISERFRHRYGVNVKYIADFEKNGLKIAARHKNYIDALEIPEHPFYCGVQFHPEFLSKPDAPRPCFIAFLSACLGVDKEQ